MFKTILYITVFCFAIFVMQAKDTRDKERWTDTQQQQIKNLRM